MFGSIQSIFEVLYLFRLTFYLAGLLSGVGCSIEPTHTGAREFLKRIEKE